MSIERRACVGSDPAVTKRLFAILVLMIGLICIIGGYLLGRMARNEVKRNTELLTFNLTTSAENLYGKAKKFPPKTIYRNDSEKIRNKLIEIFNCTDISCNSIDKYNLGEFVRNSINFQVNQILKAVSNATVFLESLR